MPEDGGCEGQCPFLMHLISLLSLCVGNTRNQLFPHGPNIPFPARPTLGSSCLWADFFSGNCLIWGKVWAGLFHLGCQLLSLLGVDTQPSLLLDSQMGHGKGRWERSSGRQGRTQCDSWRWRWDSSTVLFQMPRAALPPSPPGTVPCLWCSLLHFYCYLKIFILFHIRVASVSASNLSPGNDSGLCCWVLGLFEQC